MWTRTHHQLACRPNNPPISGDAPDDNCQGLLTLHGTDVIMESLNKSGDITECMEYTSIPSTMKAEANVHCSQDPEDKSLWQCYWNSSEFWAFLSELKGISAWDRCYCHNLPDIWTYEMLWFWTTLKLIGHVVLNSWFPSAFSVGGVLIVLEHYSSKISLRYLYNDVKMKQRIIHSRRMPYLVTFPLAFLNKRLDKLLVCREHFFCILIFIQYVFCTMDKVENGIKRIIYLLCQNLCQRKQVDPSSQQHWNFLFLCTSDQSSLICTRISYR